MVDQLNLDPIDYEIIKEMHQTENRNEYTTTELARKVYNTENNDIKSLDSKMRSKLSKLVKYDIIKKLDEQPPATYKLNYERIVIGDTKINVEAEFQGQQQKYEFDIDRILFISRKNIGTFVRGFIPYQPTKQDQPSSNPHNQ